METAPPPQVISPPSPPPPVGVPSVPSFSYASFMRRFFALLVDSLILALVNMVMGFFSSLLTNSSRELNMVMSLMVILMNFLSILIMVCYYVYFIGKSGQTPGKKLLKIKVVRVGTTNVSPGYVKAFLREIIGKTLSGILLLGYLWMLWDERKQTWHDKIAGTIVIKV